EEEEHRLRRAGDQAPRVAVGEDGGEQRRVRGGALVAEGLARQAAERERRGQEDEEHGHERPPPREAVRDARRERVDERQQRRIVGMHQLEVRKGQKRDVDLFRKVKPLPLRPPEVNEVPAGLPRRQKSVRREQQYRSQDKDPSPRPAGRGWREAPGEGRYSKKHNQSDQQRYARNRHVRQ